jgi:hypothetical protein
VGVKCSKAITRSEITRGFRVSENLHNTEGGKRTMDVTNVVRGSLRTRLIVWFLILSLVPVIVVSMLAYFNSRSSLESTYLRALDTYASLQADSISKWVEEIIHQLQIMADAPEIKSLKDDQIMPRIKFYVKFRSCLGDDVLGRPRG